MIANIILGYVLPFILIVVAGYFAIIFRDKRIVEWVKIAVEAAEQIYNESGKGKEKFEYVTEWISKKFRISKADLKNLIESAVYKLKEEKE